MQKKTLTNKLVQQLSEYKINVQTQLYFCTLAMNNQKMEIKAE